MKLKTVFSILYYVILVVAVILISKINGLNCADQPLSYSAPELSTGVSEIERKSALLIGNVRGNTDCNRGFIVSKTSTVTLENPDALVIRCEDGSGRFQILAVLQHHTVYCVASFAWYPKSPNLVGYGNVVVFKTK